MPSISAERYTRNSGVIDQEAINAYPVAIVGCGAIGSALAEQLAKMGVNRLILIDFDTVDEANLSNQGFYESEIGEPKVLAVADRLQLINSSIEVTAHVRPWLQDDSADLIPEGCVIVNAADSMDVRRQLFQTELLRRRQPVFLDGRMSAETFKGFLATDEAPETIKHYRESLFPQREMYREACTAKSTIYCASIAAGFLTSMFKSWAMREIAGFHHWLIDFDLRSYDLIRAEMTI